MGGVLSDCPPLGIRAPKFTIPSQSSQGIESDLIRPGEPAFVVA